MIRTLQLLLCSIALVLVAPLAAETAPHAQAGPGSGYARIPAGAYAVIAEVRAKPGKADQLRAVTLPLIELVRSEHNNLVYFLQENRDAPGHFIFYEIFATREDFEAHNNMPYVKEWFAKLPLFADGGVKVMRMEILDGNESEPQ